MCSLKNVTNVSSRTFPSIPCFTDGFSHSRSSPLPHHLPPECLHHLVHNHHFTLQGEVGCKYRGRVGGKKREKSEPRRRVRVLFLLQSLTIPLCPFSLALARVLPYLAQQQERLVRRITHGQSLRASRVELSRNVSQPTTK